MRQTKGIVIDGTIPIDIPYSAVAGLRQRYIDACITFEDEPSLYHFSLLISVSKAYRERLLELWECHHSVE